MVSFISNLFVILKDIFVSLTYDTVKIKFSFELSVKNFSLVTLCTLGHIVSFKIGMGAHL